MAIPKRLRFEILRRDNHACRYCGRSAPEVELSIDHVVPQALGGSDEPSNLAAACIDCNGGKASIAPDSPLVEDVAQDALRWANAMWIAAEEQAEKRELAAEIRVWFSNQWSLWKRNDTGEALPLPTGWQTSIDNFIAAGLCCDDLKELTEVSMRSRADLDNIWRYFCGCCWRRVQEYQETARGYLRDGVC